MNITELRQEIRKLEEERVKLEKAIELQRSVNSAEEPTCGWMIDIVGVYMNCPTVIAIQLCDLHVAKVREKCQIMAVRLCVDHEEPVFDE